MNNSTEPSDLMPTAPEVPSPETEPEGRGELPPVDPPAAGLPESEHSAAEHAFPTDRPLEKWINEAHG